MYEIELSQCTQTIPWLNFRDVYGLELLGDPSEDGVVVFKLPTAKK